MDKILHAISQTAVIRILEAAILSIAIGITAALLTMGCSSLNAPSFSSDLPVLYRNSQYNFTFCLPVGWQGFSVLTEEWKGITYLPAMDTDVVTEHGPIIVLRHSQWNANDPYPDIPILVFTRKQWDACHWGKFSVGAGGIWEEVAHNAKYVLAISSRFNLVDETVKGLKEAEAIVEWNRSANVHLYAE